MWIPGRGWSKGIPGSLKGEDIKAHKGGGWVEKSQAGQCGWCGAVKGKKGQVRLSQRTTEEPGVLGRL